MSTGGLLRSMKAKLGGQNKPKTNNTPTDKQTSGQAAANLASNHTGTSDDPSKQPGYATNQSENMDHPHPEQEEMLRVFRGN